MTGAIEIINGHRYWVVRDANGNILRQEGRDDMAANNGPEQVQV